MVEVEAAHGGGVVAEGEAPNGKDVVGVERCQLLVRAVHNRPGGDGVRLRLERLGGLAHLASHRSRA